MQLDLETLISAHSDSPVSQSAKQGSKRASQMTGGSGMKLLEYYKLANRNGSLLKMLKVLLASRTAYSSKIVSLAWKLKVTKYNRLLFQLVPKTHHTKEIEYGSSENLWPTPRASDVEGGVVKDVQIVNGRFFRLNEKGEKWGVKLRDAVNHTENTRLWPTPAARDYKGGYIGGRYKDGKPNNNTLDTQVQFVSNQKKEQKQLSANWVTWLMGYPEGYLDISTENQNTSQELPKEKKTEPKS